MSLALPQIESPAQLPSNVERRPGMVADTAVVARVAPARLPTLLALPLTTAIALGIHFSVSETEPPAATRAL